MKDYLFLWIIVALPGLASSQTIAARKVVAIAEGFEIRMSEASLKSSDPGYELFGMLKELGLAKADLKRLGIDSSPRAVEKWRDKKIADSQKRGDQLREVLAHPERARAIYEASVSSSIPYDKWLAWATGFKSEDQIERWSTSRTIGRYSIRGDRSEWPTWQLMEAMASEHRQKTGLGKQWLYAEALSQKDVELLAGLSVEYFEGAGESELGLSGNPTGEGKEFFDQMRRSAFLGMLERELSKIHEREVLQGLKIKLKDPAVQNVRELIAKGGQGGLTRSELMRPLTVEEAIPAMSYRDGRGAMAYLTVARAGPAAIPALLSGLSSKEQSVQLGCLIILSKLQAREALPVIHSLGLWRASTHEMANQAMSTIAKLDSSQVSGLTRTLIEEFERQPAFTGISRTYVPEQIRTALYLLSKEAGSDEELARYLKSQKDGVRLEAAWQLSKKKDKRAYAVATDLLDVDVERRMILRTLEELNLKESVKLLDTAASKYGDPRIAETARRIEFAHLPAGSRWKKLAEWASGPKSASTYWAFSKIEEGFRAELPEAISAMEVVSQSESGLYSRRAKELLGYRRR